MGTFIIVWLGVLIVPVIFCFMYLVSEVFAYDSDREEVITTLSILGAIIVWPVTLPVLFLVFLYRLVLILVGRK